MSASSPSVVGPPAVPLRSSSKKSAKDVKHLLREKGELDLVIMKARKRLRAKASLDSEYWRQYLEIDRNDLRRLEFKKRISSLQHFDQTGETEDEWMTTDEAIKLIEQETALKLEMRAIERQAYRISTESLPLRHTTSTFAECGASAGGRRDCQDQCKLRAALISVSNARHPDPRSQWLWCAISKAFREPDIMRAAHIFPYRSTQYFMNEIFATDDADGAQAERRFDSFLMVIVPLVEDESDEAQIRQWHAREANRYKIRVLEPEDKLMRERVIGNEPTMWSEIDARELEFRSSARPRARYLYYHYCVAMLKRARHKGLHAQMLKDELGRKFWGIPGLYIRRQLLRAFVDEIGRDDLYDGASDDHAKRNSKDSNDDGEDDVVRDLVLMTASRMIADGDVPLKDKPDEADPDSLRDYWPGKEHEAGRGSWEAVVGYGYDYGDDDDDSDDDDVDADDEEY